MDRPLAVLLVLLYATATAAQPPAAAAGSKPAKHATQIGRLEGCGGDFVAFSNDGTKIVTAGNDQARVWDAATLRPLAPSMPQATTFLPPALGTPQFSTDGTKLLTATENRVRLFDANTGRKLREFSCDDRYQAASMSAGASHIATIDGMVGATVTVWDATTGQPVFRVPYSNGTIEHILFNPNGTDVLVVEVLGVWDRCYHVLDVRTGQEIFPAIQPQVDIDLRTNPGCLRVSLSSDGKKLAVLNSAWFTIYDARSRKRLGKAKVDASFVGGYLNDVRFTPDGKRVISVAASVQVWDAVTLRPVFKPIHMSTYMGCWALSPDGSRVACAVSDGQGSDGLWDLSSGQKLLTFDARNNDTFAFSPDGKCLAVGTSSSKTTGSYTTLWRLPP